MEETEGFRVDFECEKGDEEEEGSASWKSELEWQRLAKNTARNTEDKTELNEDEGEVKTEDEDVKTDEGKTALEMSRADTVLVSTLYLFYYLCFLYIAFLFFCFFRRGGGGF